MDVDNADKSSITDSAANKSSGVSASLLEEEGMNTANINVPSADQRATFELDAER